MIWLLLLGVMIYVLIVQWVTGITRTPVWLLWLAAMMPAFVLTLWAVAFRGRSMPTGWVIVLFVGCIALYLYLVQRGRIASPPVIEAEPDPPLPPDPVPEVPLDQPLRPISKDEESYLLECFPWRVFLLTHIEYRPQSIVCRGQLRAAPAVAYKAVREKIEGQFGDRFHVIFQEDPNQEPFFELALNSAAISTLRNEGSGDGKPVARSIQEFAKQSLNRRGLAAGLLGLTLFTTVWAGLQIAGRVPTIPAILESGLPYALPLMAFFGLRGVGQYITARKYHITTTLPYFIPVIPLPFFPVGTIGAVTQIRSPIPDRKALFDIGLVGAFLGLCVCIPTLAWGLTQSEAVKLSEQAGLFQFQALNPRFSIVLAVFSKLALGRDLVPEAAIQLHPIAMAGWVGLVFTAFNLMPIGQLDGGRMIHAVFGRRRGARIGNVARFLLLGFAIAYPHLLLWAILLLLLPAIDEPALNDVTEVDSFRDMVGLLALVILIVIVLPVPRILMTALGI